MTATIARPQEIIDALADHPALATQFIDGGYGFDAVEISAKNPGEILTTQVVIASQNPNTPPGDWLLTLWPSRAAFDESETPPPAVEISGLPTWQVIEIARAMLYVKADS